MQNITYETNERLSAEELAELFRTSGIRRPADDLARLRRMIDGANLIVTARHDGVLVGVARALTDFSYGCYLSDLAVRADCQRQGIGKELLRIVREKIGPQVVLVLLSAQGAMSFYPRAGFQTADNAFFIPREK